MPCRGHGQQAHHQTTRVTTPRGRAWRPQRPCPCPKGPQGDVVVPWGPQREPGGRASLEGSKMLPFPGLVARGHRCDQPQAPWGPPTLVPHHSGTDHPITTASSAQELPTPAWGPWQLFGVLRRGWDRGTLPATGAFSWLGGAGAEGGRGGTGRGQLGTSSIFRGAQTRGCCSPGHPQHPAPRPPQHRSGFGVPRSTRGALPFFPPPQTFHQNATLSATKGSRACSVAELSPAGLRGTTQLSKTQKTLLRCLCAKTISKKTLLKARAFTLCPCQLQLGLQPLPLVAVLFPNGYRRCLCRKATGCTSLSAPDFPGLLGDRSELRCQKQSDPSTSCTRRPRRRSPSQLAIDSLFWPPLACSKPCLVLGKHRG